MAIDAGTLVVSVIPNTTGFTAKLTAAMSKVGGALDAAGISSTTAAIGVAVGTVAVIATKSALEFERAFTKIDAISNASQESIGKWKDQVLALSGETAQSPQELADALYFLASAGLEESQVFDVLTQSAKSSAVGLGTTGDIAKITAQALNAYAQSGLTATEVTDTLTAAVREGTAEPEEFAVALGRVLPIASRAGVSFQEVTASLASMSNIGLNVNEGTTALRGLLQALVAPSGLAADALYDVGITADQLRKKISDGGLLKALQFLEDRTGGNIDQLRKIIPNIRALTGELSLTGENAKKVQQVFDDVTNSFGDASEAFETTAKGPMFVFQQAAANAQVAMIGLGEALLPIAGFLGGVVASAFGDVAGLISRHTDAIRNLILAYLGFKAITFVPALFSAIATGMTAIAAAGLTSIASGLFSLALGLERIGATKAAGVLTNFAAILPGLAGPLVGLAATIGIVAYAFIRMKNSQEEMRAEAADLTETLLGQDATLKILQDRLGLNADQFRDWLDSVNAGHEALDVNSVAFQNYSAVTTEGLQAILFAQTGIQESFNGITSSVGGFNATLGTSVAVGEMSAGAAERQVTAFDLFGRALVDATELTNSQKFAMAGSIQEFYSLGGALNDNHQYWIANAIAASNYDSVTSFLSRHISDLRGSVDELSGPMKAQAKQFLETEAAGKRLATGLGISFGSLKGAALSAFSADNGEFGEKFDALVADITKKAVEMRDAIAEAVDFTGEKLGALSEQAQKSPQAILTAFRQARTETISFGDDLNEIAKTGGKNGKALVNTLLGMGEAGVTMAATIAGAAPKVRDSIVKAAGGAASAAQSVATKLSRTMIGLLKNISTYLHQLVDPTWTVKMDADDNATHVIEGVAAKLKLLDGTTATVIIDTRGVAHGGANSGQDTSGQQGSEFGSYIPGAARGGFVVTPQKINVAERHRAEMILPLTNSQGEKALAKAMGNAARRFDGGMVRGHDGGSAQLVISGPVKLQVGKTSMDAYISGVARSEDDKQKRYDERISRMRRD